MRTLAEVTSEALALPVEERVVLAQRVWNSVERFASSGIERAWMDEADWRWLEIEEGKAQSLPADEAMRRARECLEADANTERVIP
jgi:putative addiction module component (TIGR02574 family)